MLFCLLASDPPIGRAEYSVDAFPQQTLMEMVIAGLVNQSRLQDENGGYKDIENWNGMTFNDANEVTHVEWRDYHNKQFPHGGTLELKWLPRTVEIFALPGSGIEGTVEMALLPRRLRNLFVQRNRLTGALDMTQLPPTVNELIMQSNRFSGSLDFTRLPGSLTYMYLFRNDFIGTVRVGELPAKVRILIGETKIEAFVDESGNGFRDDRLRVNSGAF